MNLAMKFYFVWSVVLTVVMTFLCVHFGKRMGGITFIFGTAWGLLHVVPLRMAMDELALRRRRRELELRRRVGARRAF